MAEVLSFDRRRRAKFQIRRRPWRRAIPPWLPLAALIAVAAAGYLAVATLNDIGATGALPLFRTPHGVARTGTFGLCARISQENCVVDGDTVRYGGVKIRLADVDAPEIGNPKCASEAALGDRATQRLLDLMNAGPFQVVRAGGPDEDRYGRKLRVITRHGRSVADTLVAEGLARRWDGARRSWCG